MEFQDPQKHALVKGFIRDMCASLRGHTKLTDTIINERLHELETRLAGMGIKVKFALDHLEPGVTGFAGLITYDIDDSTENGEVQFKSNNKPITDMTLDELTELYVSWGIEAPDQSAMRAKKDFLKFQREKIVRKHFIESTCGDNAPELVADPAKREEWVNAKVAELESDDRFEILRKNRTPEEWEQFKTEERVNFEKTYDTYGTGFNACSTFPADFFEKAIAQAKENIEKATATAKDATIDVWQKLAGIDKEGPNPYESYLATLNDEEVMQLAEDFNNGVIGLKSQGRFTLEELRVELKRRGCRKENLGAHQKIKLKESCECGGAALQFGDDVEVCITEPPQEVTINGKIPRVMTVTTVQELPSEIRLAAPDDLGKVQFNNYILIPRNNIISQFIRMLLRIDDEVKGPGPFRKRLYDNLKSAVAKTLKEFFGEDCVQDPYDYAKKQETENARSKDS